MCSFCIYIIYVISVLDFARLATYEYIYMLWLNFYPVTGCKTAQPEVKMGVSVKISQHSNMLSMCIVMIAVPVIIQIHLHTMQFPV